MKLWRGVYSEGSVFSDNSELSANVEALQKAIAGRYRVVSNCVEVNPATLALYLAQNEKGVDTKWLKHDYPCTVNNSLRGAEYDESSFLNLTRRSCSDRSSPGEQQIYVLEDTPEAQQCAVELMPSVDRGWTAKWLSDFRINQVAQHYFLGVGELAECI